MLADRRMVVVDRDRKVARIRKFPQNNELVRRYVRIKLKIYFVVICVEVAPLMRGPGARGEGNQIAIAVEIGKKIAFREGPRIELSGTTAVCGVRARG